LLFQQCGPLSLCLLSHCCTSKGTRLYQSTTATTMAWVTQPPWLHQFRFGWTSAHPITKPRAVTEVDSHFVFFGSPFKSFFFHLQTFPAHPTTPFLYLCYIFFSSKLSFFLSSLSLLQQCHRPLLIFKEELGVAAILRCEQREVQHLLEEDTRTSYIFYIFSALKVSLHFQFGFRFMRPLPCLLSKFST
jgi:hypothetical protein